MRQVFGAFSGGHAAHIPSSGAKLRREE